MKEYDIAKSTQGQSDLWEKKGYPHFAPTNGRCWACGQNIYRKIEHTSSLGFSLLNGEKYYTGIDVESARTELITGCPHCHCSYCD